METLTKHEAQILDSLTEIEKKRHTNSKIVQLKTNPNDEVYTPYSLIADEMQHWEHELKDKVIYLPCDTPFELFWHQDIQLKQEQTNSQFWNYFHKNFKRLGLKKLIATYLEHDTNKQAYVCEYEGGNDEDINQMTKTPLQGNGDFRNSEMEQFFKACDLVITNPPFSLFKEFYLLLKKYNKKFLIIALNLACQYSFVRDDYFYKNSFNLGYTITKAPFVNFANRQEEGIQKLNMNGLVAWRHNLEYDLEKWKKMHLTYTDELQEPDEFFDAPYNNILHVKKSRHLETKYKNYYGLMGITVAYFFKKQISEILKDFNIIETKNKKLKINGKTLFQKIIIQRKKPDEKR
ncbi:adenine-specific methyltransferase EcoRI family protein [[Mycoplasma] gypis]|uniref:Adenine-specific methyltransferase EcoRI family protein n=1 Tax=[Mycoplasma] gypis TaxID=92404 RepID=A0ABZ2RNL3_9BACT|nr:adenine-specific methyltransferase EcoRI family protein [[Mycoplasma] gypis]MBN0919449.1 hypothetical protein [[Mycoplasma] gypis]